MIRLLFLLFLVGCSDDLVNNDLIEPIKNLILAHAFSKTGLIKDE